MEFEAPCIKRTSQDRVAERYDGTNSKSRHTIRQHADVTVRLSDEELMAIQNLMSTEHLNIARYHRISMEGKKIDENAFTREDLRGFCRKISTSAIGSAIIFANCNNDEDRSNSVEIVK